MTRELSSANVAEVTAAYLEQVLLLKVEFSAATLLLHSHYGNITYAGDTYIGVGHLGAVSAIREQSPLSPSPIELTLSGLNPVMRAAVDTSGEYKAPVTLYEGYRLDNGLLADCPRVAWSGWWEHATLGIGADMIVRATAQHDLAVLDETDGGRFSEEDQVERYPSDGAFKFIAFMADLRLAWGGGKVGTVVGINADYDGIPIYKDPI